MKRSSLYKRLFICQLILVSIHIFSVSGVVRLAGLFMMLLGFISLVSLVFKLYIKSSKKKKSSFPLKECHVPFPRFARDMEWEDFEKRRINEETPITIPLLVTSLKINDLLHKLLNNVINEFVLGWYNAITPSRSFLYELENVLYTATSVIISHLKKANFEDFLGKKVLPILYNHIREFNQARTRISTINSGNPELKISMYYNHGKLHPAVLPTLSSTQKLEYNHLRKFFEKIVPILLDKNLGQSRGVVILIREIFVCKVIQPLIDMLSDPDFYNQEFIDLSERFFGKSDYIQYVNEALGNGTQYKKQIEIPQTYEDFLRMIKECNNLRTACLLRNDIIKEIKLNKAQIANLNRSDVVHGVKVYRIQAYINRIESALKYCEKRIKELGGPDFQKLENNIDIPSSLYDVLATPLGRYYFTQYMEHHNQSHLYNFWMEVQRLRILPEITSSNKKEVIEESKSLNPKVDKETIRENVWNIYNTYLFPDANDYNQKVEMSLEIINAIEIFLYGRPQQTSSIDLGSIANANATTDLPPVNEGDTVNMSESSSSDPDNDYTCIFRAQKYVYDLMESKYYSKFIKSTLYFRFLHDLTSNDEYKNKILQKISNIGYNSYIDPNNGKFRGKIKAMRKKRENSLIRKSRKSRHHHSHTHSNIGRHNSLSSSSYSDKNRRYPNRRKSSYSIRKSQLSNTYYNNYISRNQSTQFKNTNNNNTGSTSFSVTIPPPSQPQDTTSSNSTTHQNLNANQMQLLNEAMNHSITEPSQSFTVDSSEPIHASGTMDHSQQSSVSILENYKNQWTNDKDHLGVTYTENKSLSSPSNSNTSSILPGNTMVSDPQSFVDKNAHSRQSSDKPHPNYSRIYYSVHEYFEDDGTLENLEEEYVDDFDDDEEEHSLFMSSSYSPSVASTSFSTRFSVNSHNEFHTRKKRSKKYYNSIKVRRPLNRKNSKEDYNVNSLKHDIMHFQDSNHISLDETEENSDNEWEDEDDYLFFNTKNLYSYDEIPETFFHSSDKGEDGKSSDSESVTKTITYDYLREDTSTPEDYTSPSVPLSTPRDTYTDPVIINNHYIDLMKREDESRYHNTVDQEVFNPTETIYYNTKDQEEIDSTPTTSETKTKPLDENENAPSPEAPPPNINIVIRGPSEDDNTPVLTSPLPNNRNENENSLKVPCYISSSESEEEEERQEHDKNSHGEFTTTEILRREEDSIESKHREEILSDAITTDHQRKSIQGLNHRHDSLRSNSSDRQRDKNIKKLSDSSIHDQDPEEVDLNHSNSLMVKRSHSSSSLSRKSSFKNKLKSNLNNLGLSSSSSTSLGRKSSFKDLLKSIEGGHSLKKKRSIHGKKKGEEAEKISTQDKKKEEEAEKISTQNQKKGEEAEKTSIKDKRKSDQSLQSPLTKEANEENDLSDIQRKTSNRSLGYASDGDYDKLDYVPPTEEGLITKNNSRASTSSSITHSNAIHVSKRESSRSSTFSISNNLKMEILNREEAQGKKKEETNEGKAEEEEEEDMDGGSLLYKDKFSLSKKASTESQRSHKGLKKLFNSKLKRKEKKKILEDARKVQYDEEEEEEDMDDAKSNGLSVVSDESNGEGTVTSFHYASPGDLLVSSLITQVDESMKELEAQKANIDDLMTNAVLHKETRRLELLQDAKSQLESHVKDLEKQKELYILQAKENAITPENVTISIPDCHIKHDGNKNYALYIIEVNRTNPNGCTSGWIVTRRYSEFVLLHQQLRNKFWNIVHRYELPGKNMLSWIIPKPDVQLRRVAIEKRRVALEKYLRNLISHDEICQSIELRKFISQQNVDMPPSFKYKQINLDEYNVNDLKRKNALRLDSESSLSSIGAIPLTKERNNTTREINMSNPQKFITKSMPDVFQETNNTEEIKKSISLLENHVKRVEKRDMPQTQTLSNINFDGFKGGKIIDGIFDIVMEIFGIKNKIDWYNWLQHKAFLSFFQQIFSGTLDKKIRQDIQYLVSETMIEFYLNQLNDTLWPGGEFFITKRNREWEENHIPFERTEEQKKKTKIECYQKLTTQLPELLGGLIGKKKANYGAEFLFELFQNRRLNQHLMYTLFDELFKFIFPEIENDI